MITPPEMQETVFLSRDEMSSAEGAERGDDATLDGVVHLLTGQAHFKARGVGFSAEDERLNHGHSQTSRDPHRQAVGNFQIIRTSYCASPEYG